MSAKLIVVQKLLNTAAVTALVAKKIWLNKARQGLALPFIVISKPGNENRQLLEGDAGFQRTRIRVECLGSSAGQAAAVQRVAFDALKNVTREVIGFDDGLSPASFSAIATIVPSNFETDGYSDIREADAEIFDVYVDWKLN